MHWTSNPLIKEPVHNNEYETELIECALKLNHLGKKLFDEIEENGEAVREAAIYLVAYIYFSESLPEDMSTLSETPDDLLKAFESLRDLCSRTIPFILILAKKGYPTTNEENFSLMLFRTIYVLKEYDSYLERIVIGEML